MYVKLKAPNTRFVNGFNNIVKFWKNLIDFQTGLPKGEYCDVITGENLGRTCTGSKVHVNENGFAHIYISNHAEDMHMSVHVGKEVETNALSRRSCTPPPYYILMNEISFVSVKDNKVMKL